MSARSGAVARATDFEFRHRFFLIAGVFVLAFLAYRVDRTNAAAALLATLGVAPSKEALRALFVAGAGLATLGAALRTWASAFLSGAVVHDTALHSERLVADGPYRFVRNPLYLGLALLALGQAPIASRAGALVLLVGLGGLGFRLIGREEAALVASQGASYREFLSRVPRFVPALTPQVPASGRRAAWRDGLLSEVFMWVLTLATWAFALTLDSAIFGLACAAGLALYWPVALWQKRERARHSLG